MNQQHDTVVFPYTIHIQADHLNHINTEKLKKITQKLFFSANICSGSNLVDANGQITPDDEETPDGEADKPTSTSLTIECNAGYSLQDADGNPVLDADGNKQSSVTKLLVCETDQTVHADYTLPTCEGKNTTLHYTILHSSPKETQLF